MNKALIGISTAALLLAVSSAHAADPMMGGPSGNAWDGMYAGISLGVVTQGIGQLQDVTPQYSNTSAWQNVTGGRGFLFGGQIGYDFTVSESVVLGIAADIKGIFSENAVCADVNCAAHQNGSPALGYNINGTASITGRVGFIPAPNMLVYVLAGPSAAVVTTHHWDREDMPNNTIFGGFTVGIGGEMMVSDNVSVGVEARYSDFGAKAVPDQSGEDFNYHPKSLSLALTSNIHF